MDVLKERRASNISRDGKHLDRGAMGSACSSIAATRADGQRTDS